MFRYSFIDFITEPVIPGLLLALFVVRQGETPKPCPQSAQKVANQMIKSIFNENFSKQETTDTYFFQGKGQKIFPHQALKR